jgi:hypothetical protein
VLDLYELQIRTGAWWDRLDRDRLTLSIDTNLDGSTRATPARDPARGRGFVVERDDELSGLSKREALPHH